MATTIVYDSVFGNTAQIARAIEAGLVAAGESVRIVPVSEANRDDLTGSMLIVGSPTRGFRPTPAISEFVAGLDGTGHRAAVFDTRIDLETVHPAPLRWVVEAGGYASARIGAMLREKGFDVRDDAGFKVSGTEGPLLADEIERATAWGKALAAEIG